MASIFRASLRPFFRAVDQTFFPRSCPVRWKSASSQAQVKLLILRKRITNRMCSYIITSYFWLIFRIFFEGHYFDSLQELRGHVFPKYDYS